MPDIKTKNNKTIKKINKPIIIAQRIKNNVAKTKNIEDINKEKEDNQTNYAINKISEQIHKMPSNINRFNKVGKQSFYQTKQNINIARNKINNYNKRKRVGNAVKNMKNSIKTSKNAIKTTERAVKTTKETAKVANKVAKKSLQMAKTAVKNTARGVKFAVKAVATTIKLALAGTKALITALAAGGWIVVAVIVIVCVIAMVCNSIFGIFFSNENDVGDIKMSSVISEINTEFTNKIVEIQKNNEHDDYEINSNRAEWKEVLSIYAVVISNGEEATNVITLDDDKINKLKDIFWQMNTITSRVEEQERDIETTDESSNTIIQKVKRKVLYIDITSKSLEEMKQIYNFNNEQILQLAELQKDEYNSIWSHVVYGTQAGNNDIVEVARSQIGNVGGQPYWSWYGYTSRVEWCACFVSWCANESGYIDAGIIPKFSNCQNEGIAWFKACGLWKDNKFTPNSGDIIFFDWENDKKSDHVGIVEKVEDEKVYTIEGNSSGDMCKENSYDINSRVIMGYGTPMY